MYVVITVFLKTFFFYINDKIKYFSYRILYIKLDFYIRLVTRLAYIMRFFFQCYNFIIFLLILNRIIYKFEMNVPGTVSKIFWPAHVCRPRTKAGFLVGWNIRSFTTCIAAVISDVKV